MKATINSDKHLVGLPVVGIASGARTFFPIVTVDNDLALASDVRVGAVIKAVFIEIWAASATANLTIISAFGKLPTGSAAPTFAEMLTLSAYAGKKNLLETHQGLAPSSGNVVPMYRHWIKIPKGKQRMGLGDVIGVTIAAVGATMTVCGIFVFKEYY